MKKFFLGLLICCGFMLNSPGQEHNGFVHKGYLGWLIDLSRTARIGIPWPAIPLDDALLEDYKETIDFLSRSGMNEITAWGFFTNSAWEPEIEKTIDEGRKSRVREMIAYAHGKGIKILCGLGVYSWGFNKILKEYPEIQCPCNQEVMDFAKPESWIWQQKVLDYLIENFDFDGFSMQSADRGRCKCGEYEKLSDLQYHAMLDQKVVQYIRSKKKNSIIGISGWGMNFGNPKDLPSIVEMTRNVDYLIDVEETALKSGTEYRKKLIKAIAPCQYGNTSTPNIEPIQALPRDNYFVPVFIRSCMRLKEIYNEGGRACETYVRTRGNIGDEVSIEVIAKILNKPGKDIRSALREVIRDLFNPSDEKTLNTLTEIFEKAEDAYFSFATGNKEVIQLMPRNLTLPKSQYLIAMKPQARENYKKIFKTFYSNLSQIKNNMGNEGKYNQLMQCLANVLMQIQKLEQ